MALFTKNFKQLGKSIFLLFIICILTGCTSQKAPSGISEEEPVETENAIYEIGEQETEKGVSYPQIVLKGEEDTLLQELENGNYELDQDAYALWQSESELVIQSIREHLQKIRDRGQQDVYFGYMKPYKIGTRGMYLKEGRVGLFIFLPERWEELAMWVSEDQREMPRAVHILAGTDYHVALCEDGTVWSWGDNADGKLGMAVDTLSQPERIPGLEEVVKIVDGGKDIFALTAGGEVYYWGWGLENIRYPDKQADNMVCTPTRLEGLEEIVDMDGKNRRLFVLDKEGRLYSLGLCLDYASMSEPVEVFFGHEELGRDIDRIVAGAGNYHYFIRKDGTVCSIMESFDDIFTPYMFIFPAEGEGMPGAETYAGPEEMESLVILEDAKPDHVVYYDLAGVGEVEAASADGYTVFLSRTDGSLWYWDSDRIKYHDDERALIDAESARESCTGRFVQIDIGGILNMDGEAPTPRIAAMESGTESTLFLTDDGSVFVSRYETCGVEDVSCFVKSNPNPGKLPSVETIEGMELKTLVFERLALENIVSISTDGENNFTAVDADGVYYRFDA